MWAFSVKFLPKENDFVKVSYRNGLLSQIFIKTIFELIYRDWNQKFSLEIFNIKIYRYSLMATL